MLVAEIATYAELANGTNIVPFVRQFYLTRQTLAAYWTGAFGAADDQTTLDFLHVSGVTYNLLTRYTMQASLVDCESQEGSFYYDGTDVLYVHYNHYYDEWCGYTEYSQPQGFTNKRLVYIDGICYEALLRGNPSIAQQQDWLNYDQPSFINGSLEFDNVGGAFDFAITSRIFGNDVFLYYLVDDGADDFSRADLVPMAAFYVEDYRHTLKAFSTSVQDKRVAQNIEIPTELFTKAEYPGLADDLDNTTVPLAYGPIRVSKGIPVAADVSAGVTYRQAVTLNSLGTVQVMIDDLWIEVIPLSTNTAHGEFTLAHAEATDGQGNPLPCRVLGSVGIAIARASDVIVDLNLRYLGLVYNASNYDTTEWTAEEAALGLIGITFDKQIVLYEAIRMVQAGSNVGFRYEITPDGRRTIRINDWARPVAMHIVGPDMANLDELPVDSKDEDIASEVRISYAPDFNEGTSLTVRNTDNADGVLINFRMRSLFQLDTYLPDSVSADACAAWYAGRLDVIHGVAEITLRGIDKLATRIYDILEAEITPGFVDADALTIVGRKYYGIWKVQVLAVDPDEDLQQNKVKALLIQEIATT